MIKFSPGDRYGSLEIIGPAAPSERYPKKRMWACRCNCGNTVELPANYIKNGVVTSCGCGRHAPRLDVAGERHGMLVGLAPTGQISHGSAVWSWQCDCGNIVEATVDSVRWGGKISCGCAQKRSKLENAVLAREAQPIAYGTNLSLITGGTEYASNTSGVRGVNWHKGTQRWQARIQFRRKVFHLGYYSSLQDAAQARKEAEENIHGDFVRWYIRAHPQAWAEYAAQHPDKAAAIAPANPSSDEI